MCRGGRTSSLPIVESDAAREEKEEQSFYMNGFPAVIPLEMCCARAASCSNVRAELVNHSQETVNQIHAGTVENSFLKDRVPLTVAPATVRILTQYLSILNILSFLPSFDHGDGCIYIV